jgi:hypothetical protein
MVGGTGVKDPTTMFILLRLTDIGKELLLLDVDDAVRCWRRGRGCHDNGVDDDNGDLSRTASWARRRLCSSSSPWVM